MNTDIEPRTGNWLLVVWPRKIVPTLLKMIARLAEAGASVARPTGMLRNAAETAAPRGCSANGGLSHGDASQTPPRPAVRVVDCGNLYDVYQGGVRGARPAGCAGAGQGEPGIQLSPSADHARKIASGAGSIRDTGSAEDVL